MKEWEQIKKEYREIPVPTNGPHQMLQTIAEAKRKRSQWKRMTRYGTVAAAALLVLLLPGMLLFSGGFGAFDEKNMSMEADYAIMESTQGSGWLEKASTDEMNMTPSPANDALETESAYDNMSNAGGSGAERGETSNYSYNNSSDALEDLGNAVTEEKQSLKAEAQEAISKEILRQMEERMQKGKETYYIRGEEYPEGFELVAPEQNYYINEEGLLVIVFEAGTVAPSEQGDVEFIIPAEVFSPEE